MYNRTEVCFMNEAGYICFPFGSLLLLPTLFVKSVLYCNVVFLWEVTDHYIRSTYFVCLLSSYGQFPVVGSDQLNSLSCDSISWPNRPLQHSKSPKCVLFLKKTWMKCTVNRGELPLRVFLILLQMNHFPEENLYYPDRFYSKGMLFLVLWMRGLMLRVVQ